MNEYDSEKMADLLDSTHGYTPAKTPEEADVILLNTCSIREKAQEKVFHQLGRWKNLKQDKPDLLIGVGGCVASQEGDVIRQRAPYVDLVFGPQTLHRLPEMINELQGGAKSVIDVSFPEIEKFDRLPEPRAEGPTAFVSIMEGCSKYCTFCVVPYTRGEEVSRPVDDVLLEIAQLAGQGVREVNLLGQNVNAYLYEKNGKEYRLSDLIMELDKFPELKRIRYTTSHPIDMTDDLIQCYAKSKKLVPFIHLPIQSGSDKILKLMNRNHTVEYYLSIYKKLKKINPEIEFSSDFIIAYPGETNKDFEDTIKLIKKLKFINSYSFIFSPRPGTAASNLNLIDKKLAKERLKIAQNELFLNQILKNKKSENKVINVLVENKMKNQEKFFGRAEHMTAVIFDGKKDIEGKIVPVLIESSNQNNLFGKLKINKSVIAA